MHLDLTKSNMAALNNERVVQIDFILKSHNSFLPPKLVNSIFLDAVNEQEIIEICSTCRSGTAVGYDNISMNLIKESIDIIISPLTCIINLSITSGIVPKQLKIGRVIPLFKSGEQNIFTNYRPVSVLPAFSKESNVQSSFKVS